MSKGFQAKHIDTLAALKVLVAAEYPRWTSLVEAFPNLPAKVCLAKYRKLMKAEMIDGCDCGCQTVATLTPKGRYVIAEALMAGC